MKEDNIYKELDHIDDFKIFDVDKEWSAFLVKTKAKDRSSATDLGINSSSQTRSAIVRNLPLRLISIAASITVLIGCFFFLTKPTEPDVEIAEAPIEVEIQQKVTPIPPNKQEQIQETVITDIQPQNQYKSYDVNEQVSLPDGSTIQILAAATLKIPQTFEGLSERRVEIQNGDVEFSIVKNESQPFRVLTDNSGIFITGTTFRLIKSGLETIVKTISGSVEMYSLDDESIKTTINAGEEFSFDGTVIKEVIAEAPVVEDQEEKLEEEEEEVKTAAYALQNIQDIAKQYFKDNLKFERKAVPKSLETEALHLPSHAINFGDVSTVDAIMKALNEQYKVEFEPIEGCNSCYKIKSISKKE